jgi:hypothetical protein
MGSLRCKWLVASHMGMVADEDGPQTRTQRTQMCWLQKKRQEEARRRQQQQQLPPPLATDPDEVVSLGSGSGEEGEDDSALQDILARRGWYTSNGWRADGPAPTPRPQRPRWLNLPPARTPDGPVRCCTNTT